MVFTSVVTQENSTDNYKTPTPVQDDTHEVYLCSYYNYANLWTTQENPNDIPITVRDNNPQVSYIYIIIIMMLLYIIKLQSPSSSLPLYGDVLSRPKTPPSVQYDVTNSTTIFQSSKILNYKLYPNLLVNGKAIGTCSFERESTENGNISKPLPCFGTFINLQLTFSCNNYGQILSGDSLPSNKDEVQHVIV